MEIACPHIIDKWSPVKFQNTLSTHLSDHEVTIDFSTITFAKPIGTLLLAENLREFVSDRKQRGLVTGVKNPANIDVPARNALSYLRHVGFFRFVGLDIGKSPGEATASENYVPLTLIDFNNMRVAEGSPKQAVIQDQCSNLSSVITGDESGQIMLTYCLREIVRNAYEHAQVGHCTIMAQRYRTGRVEVAILDTGVGIHGSLSQSHELPTVDTALEMSIQAGGSRVEESDSTDKWSNTGFGLFVLSSLAKAHGIFDIGSQGRVLTVSKNSNALNDLPVKGTLLGLDLNIEHAEYFPNQLKTMVEQGEEEIYLRTGRRKSASPGSRGLW